ncbi:kelch repeat-containing protein [Aquimarina pacifica]|uniref:kelch repeat-containing protein n=1 Tax=Aquimarina pacifica TaxID=1296415 RepID=UPI00054D8ED5|nr:kelch repeat-containing protein [Aquimarina pacifica]
MLKIKLYLVPFLISMLLIGCKGDDNNVLTDDDQDEVTEEETVEEQIEEIVSVLTENEGSFTKAWKVNSAVLNNSSGEVDISNNFNVTDDEFIFTFDDASKSTILKSTGGTLEWRQGNAIAYDASNAEEAELDLNASSLIFPFIINEEDPTELLVNATGTDFVFEKVQIITEENTLVSTLEMIIKSNDGETLDFELSEKLEEDYAIPPSEKLEFTEAFTIQDNRIRSHAPGMRGSYSDNSMFVANRADDLGSPGNLPEKIVKFSLDTNESTEYINVTTPHDFVSKQMHVLNNKLVVVGGQYVSTYPLDLSGEPEVATHGLVLSRFGSAVKDNEIYIVGGSLNPKDGDPIPEYHLGDEIFKWNVDDNSLEEIAKIPEIRSGARCEIVNDKLYIFGGSDYFFSQPAKNTIYVYDFKTGEVTTEFLPRAVNFTYVGTFENLIYVSGQIETQETDADTGEITIDRDPFIGVYDTFKGIFTELEHNLESPELETIHSMAIFNDKLFIIYGQQTVTTEEEEEGVVQAWSILQADLN